LVLVIFGLPVLVLVSLYAAAPQRASTMLEALQVWMGKHNRTITIMGCSVVGVFFLSEAAGGRESMGDLARCARGIDMQAQNRQVRYAEMSW